jgi:uncharacterized oxidoreductase
MLIASDRLEDVVRRIFAAAGSNEREAGLIARHLVEANLRGHDSHGVGVLPGYIVAARDGHLKLNHSLAIAHDSGGLLVCDASQGAGQVMAHDAIQHGIDRARHHGFAIIALRNSYHIGRIGHWAEQCAAAGLASVHFVNVPGHAAAAPFGGTRARLGTNPFAAGFPNSGGDPVIVDFATSRWALGKVRVAMNRGETVPPGTLLDAAGKPTVDPAAMFTDPAGALLAFGEHKGFGLALACELFAGALIGGATQNGVPRPAIINSMLSIAFDPASFGPAAAYEAHVSALLRWVISDCGPKAVQLPGEPERTRREKFLREGLSIDPATWAAIIAAAASVGFHDLQRR